MSNNKDIVSLFKKAADEDFIWQAGLDSIDSVLFPDETKSFNFRCNFSIPDDEQILYVRDTSFWSSEDQGLAITDKSIYVIIDNDEPDKLLSFDWAFISEVDYQEFSLIFQDGTDSPYKLPISWFIKNADEHMHTIGQYLAELFSEAAQKEENPIGAVLEEFYHIQENQGEEAAIGYAMESVKTNQYATTLYDEIATYLLENERWEEALEYCNDGLRKVDEDSNLGVRLTQLHGYAALQLGDAARARRDAYKAFINAPNDLEWGGEKAEDKARDLFMQANMEFTKGVLELPYKERKLIMPAETFRRIDEITSFLMLDIEDISDIQFPMDHPVANQLYVGHPLIKNKYMPFEHYQLELVEDKIREFCYMAQCLGATEISIESLNTNNTDSANSYKSNVHSNGGNALVSADFQSNNSGSRRLINELSKSISLHQEFEPSKEPYLPENLVWFDSEPSWQRLYAQRMNGNLKSHEERIETKKSQLVDSRELSKLKTEIETLYADMDMEFSNEEEESFAEQENALLAIKVKFASMKELGANQAQQPGRQLAPAGNISDKEQEYLDEVEACLENDGTITERERRLLDKIRKMNGISENRAQELEDLLSAKSLTPEEKEYLEEYREIISDGEISARDRRFLDKLKAMNGISEERALQLEKLT